MITKKQLYAVLMDTRKDVEWLYRKVGILEDDMERLYDEFDSHWGRETSTSKRKKEQIKVSSAPSKVEKVKVAYKVEIPEKKRGRGRPRKNV